VFYGEMCKVWMEASDQVLNTCLCKMARTR
jgi:hypothetical protein